jgi:hypothetical protein
MIRALEEYDPGFRVYRILGFFHPHCEYIGYFFSNYIKGKYKIHYYK